MTVGTGLVQIQEALKQLRVQWAEVQLHWKDPVQHEFERDFLEPLAMQVVATHQAMEQLAQMITSAQQDTRRES